MITGSHNPAEFNGFKLCVGKETIYGEEIQKLKGLMEEMQAGQPHQPAAGRPRSGHLSLLPDYIAHLQELFTSLPRDSAQGGPRFGQRDGRHRAPAIIRAMGCEVIELFSEPDGRFPNHHPDPTVPEEPGHAHRYGEADQGRSGHRL